jgi:hypothetical protein
MKLRSEAAQTGMDTRRIWRFGQRTGALASELALWPARREDSAGVLDSTSKNPTERNEDKPGCTAVVEAS